MVGGAPCVVDIRRVHAAVFQAEEHEEARLHLLLAVAAAYMRRSSRSKA
jgi:hypothetical protein